MGEPTPETISRILRERGARYVVDSQSRPVAVLLTIEEHERYLDLLDDKEDSQDQDLEARLTQAAGSPSDAERLSLRDYLLRRPPADASVPG